MVLKMSRMKYAPLLVFQLILMALYFIFVRYGDDKDVGIKGKYNDKVVFIFKSVYFKNNAICYLRNNHESPKLVLNTVQYHR